MSTLLPNFWRQTLLFLFPSPHLFRIPLNSLPEKTICFHYCFSLTTLLSSPLSSICGSNSCALPKSHDHSSPFPNPQSPSYTLPSSHTPFPPLRVPFPPSHPHSHLPSHPSTALPFPFLPSSCSPAFSLTEPQPSSHPLPITSSSPFPSTEQQQEQECSDLPITILELKAPLSQHRVTLPGKEHNK